ncbi:N/A [soil metagenome]
MSDRALSQGQAVGGTGTNCPATGFSELDELLADLTQSAQAVLGANFVGAYLQGSFAVGDADLHSDCDFLIPVHGPLSAEQERALRALHHELPTRPGHWSRHLEGSYPHLDELRSLDGMGVPWLYIDHGWREMQWSTHCNTEVVRWSLRECGVTLAGPNPKDIVDEVPGDVLRAVMRRSTETWLEDMYTWITFDIAWAQRYAVTTYCRMLHTLATGRVTSKKAALEWAMTALDVRWTPLLHQVIEDRQLGFDPEASPRPGAAEATLAFVDYAKRSARSGGASPGGQPDSPD